MADRNRILELQTVVGHIEAASNLGLTLTEVLRTQAAALRERKRLSIVEEGGKGSIRMVIPVAVFILPVLFVILLAPAAASVATWGPGCVSNRFAASDLPANWALAVCRNACADVKIRGARHVAEGCSAHELR